MKARASVTALFLLWTCGVCLRLTVLAVPPRHFPRPGGFTPVRHCDRGAHRSSGDHICAVAATPGSTLIARFGVRRTLVTGLLIAALGSAARVIWDNAAALYLASIVMSAGIAIMQPTVAAAVRQWVPDRATLGTAVYTNGLIFGEIIPVAITLPLLVPLLGGWRGALGVWSMRLARELVLSCMSGEPPLPSHILANSSTYASQADSDKTLFRLGS